MVSDFTLQVTFAKSPPEFQLHENISKIDLPFQATPDWGQISFTYLSQSNILQQVPPRSL